MSTDHPAGTSSSTLENLQEQAGEKVSQLTEGVKEGVMRSEKSFRGNLSKQADDFANALRSAKSEVDPDSSVATMFDYAADNVGGIAQSLKATDVTEMLEGVRSFARSRPGAFLGIAGLAGFAVTRFLLASEPARNTYGDRSRSGSHSSGTYGAGNANRGSQALGSAAMRGGSTGTGASSGATGSSYGIGSGASSDTGSGAGSAGSTGQGSGGAGSYGAGSSASGTPSSTVTSPTSTSAGSRDTSNSAPGTRNPGSGGSNV